MRCLRVIFLFALFITTTASPSVAAKKNLWDVKLPFKRAIISYEVSGNETGSETLYIRKYGKETVRIRKSSGKVMFISTETNSIEITTPDLLITIDMKKKEGHKVTNPQKLMMKEYEKLSSKEKATVHKNVEKMGKPGTGMAARMGAKIKPKAGKHLGYTCDIITFMGSTVYQMSDTPIALKVNSSMLGITMNSVATSIKKKSPPSSVFNIPGGVDIRFDKKVDDMNREMAKNMMNMLKDPEAGKKMDKAGRDMEQASQDRERDRENETARGDESSEPEEEKSQSERMLEKGLGALKGLF